MNSVGFALWMFFVCITFSGSNALSRVGAVGGNNMVGIRFPIGPTASFSILGQVQMSIEKYATYKSLGQCTMSMDQSKYGSIFKGQTPIWVEFPFTGAPSSDNYSVVHLIGTSTVTPVPASAPIPYHVDVTFTLSKAFLAVNPATPLQVYFSEKNIVDSQYLFLVGTSSTLDAGAVYELLDGEKKILTKVTIDKTTAKYLGPTDRTEQPFTLISLKK